MDSSDIPQKQCSTCPNSYPATPEFFDRDRQKKDGLSPKCKPCRKAHHAAHVDEQYLEYHRQYYQEHKEELSQKKKANYDKEKRRHYNSAHRAQNAERMRQYRQTPKNKAYREEYGPRHYQAHRIERIEKRRQYYELHKDEINARRRQYRKEHPEIVSGIDRAHKHKRKAQKRAVGGSYTAQQIQEQLKRQKSRCYYCKAKLETWHADHIVPLARGGSNDISNIVIACPACNMHKHDKPPHEWLDGGRLL